MPNKPKRPCSYPGCPRLVDGQYCEEHKRLTDKQYNLYGIAVKDESRVDIYTEPTDESNDYIRVNAVYIDGEKYEFCEWCKELMPIDEMREEIQLGYLCNTCQKAIASRGESLTYKD